MSDLYHETAPADSGTSSETGSGYNTIGYEYQNAAQPEPGRAYESPAETERYADYHETEAGTEARIAEQDELPTPAESRAATWGDNPGYYDEAESSPDYDGDVEAFIAEQDELPTPQESRARTWGDSPEYYDETDLASQYDGDLSALAAEGPIPLGSQETVVRAGDYSSDDQHGQAGLDASNDFRKTVPLEVPEDRAVPQEGDADPVSVADEYLAAGSDYADLEPALDSSGQEHKTGTATEPMSDESTDAASVKSETHVASDNGNVDGELGTSRSPVDARDRIAELEARLERLERAGQASETKISGKDLTSDQQAETEATEGHPHRWRGLSDEALALGAAAAGGMITTISDYVPFVHAEVAGMVASSVAVGAAGITWMRSRREGKHGHRPKD